MAAGGTAGDVDIHGSRDPPNGRGGVERFAEWCSAGGRKLMSAVGRIGLGVAAGYLLGRTKKLKLAISVGSMLAGRRIATDRAGLMRQGAELVDNNPELAKLRDQLTGKVVEAAKAAAIT